MFAFPSFCLSLLKVFFLFAVIWWGIFVTQNSPISTHTQSHVRCQELIPVPATLFSQGGWRVSTGNNSRLQQKHWSELVDSRGEITFIHLSCFPPHNLVHVPYFSHFFQSCIESKDHLNFCYFHKRALFVAIIAGHLMKKKSLFCDVKFTHDCGDHLLPIITLRPKSK